MQQKIFAGELRVFRGDGGVETATPAVPTTLKPIYLLSDSQLLFWRDGGRLFADALPARTGKRDPTAAYLGASNGDNGDFYAIFTAAMEGAGLSIDRCRLVPSRPEAQDVEFLERADVIVLAGGDVERGWRSFVETGVREVLARRYYEGAVLVGVSAGAVQLGMFGWPEGSPGEAGLFGTLGLVPFVVDAHAEADEWSELRRVVGARGGGVQGVGIPRGGGVVFHPDRSLEAVRHPVYVFDATEGGTTCSLILPPVRGA
jgi:peptidase E